MPEKKEQLVIGLTGPFGSGCSTLARVLEQNYGFKVYSLSKTLRKEWSATEGKPVEEASRKELQRFGNQLRLKVSFHIWAEKAFKQSEEDNVINDGRLIYDSIRNTAEVDFFRRKFPNFLLIAVDADEPDRWRRVEESYGRSHKIFKEDDNRDRNEEGIPHGQQVALCVDDADVLIRNDNDPMVTTELGWMEKLSDKMKDFIELFEGKLRVPYPEETYMSMAYTASLMSQCFKRQVGAVILDEIGRVVGTGFNENPPPLRSCIKEFGDCFREMYIEGLMNGIHFCPECGHKLERLVYPYDCPNCQENVYRIIVGDRALGRCSALHAEERAIINAGAQNLKGCSLYVTTFPCFSCAHNILDVGIRTVYYVESYPDLDSLHIFERAGTVRLEKFEGVKAQAYFRFFSHWRRDQETRVLRRRVCSQSS
jgi:deoxycytidylate deaminase/cytidylate kinase